MEDLKLYEYKIENIDIDGMTANSFVESPAIEEDFKLFKKQKIDFKIEKNLVYGPAIVPDRKILRKTKDRGFFNIYFSKKTVRDLAEQFIKTKKDNITIDHFYNANNIDLVEFWIIEDSKNDKANFLGWKDLPVGTLMMGYRVNNEKVLERIKKGELKGFSIELFISDEEINKDDEKYFEGENILEEIYKIMNDDKYTDNDKYDLVYNILK